MTGILIKMENLGTDTAIEARRCENTQREGGHLHGKEKGQE